MATHDISLPSNSKPVFPERCVCCEKGDPGGRATLTVTGASTGAGLGEAALDAALGTPSRAGSNQRVTVEVPACPSCGKSLERRHLIKSILLYAGALGGAAMLGISLMVWHSGWMGGFFLAAGILGPVIWELRSPPAFTFTPSGAKTSYEFRSESYAQAFAALNPASPAPPDYPSDSIL